MSSDPNAQFDQAVLEMIEHSPGGAVPNTPSYQDALRRLYAAHQVYAHADFKGGHVTARTLAQAPHFHANNLGPVVAGTSDRATLESNASIFTRYVVSLPPALRDKAEALRAAVAGRPPVHRIKVPASHDLLHTLVLLPGTGPHHGLPGNYLFGFVMELGPDAWAVQLHDCDDGVAMFTGDSAAAVVTALEEAEACAPFHLSELAAFGFRMN